ncbi:MAG: M50 family metallopeptidase [Minisyncoccia bacterium]
MSILIFIIILAILVLVHEFGHFIVAKKSGIRVDEFGLGFPPKIYSKTWRGTLYTLNSIPFGGFVKIFGEDAHSGDIMTEADKSVSFVYKSKWIQAAVLVAGVTMNIIFAWLVISISFLIGVQASTDYGGFGEVQNPKLTIVEVVQDSPAMKAGLIPGDEIVSVSAGDESLVGQKLDSSIVSSFIKSSTAQEINVSYKRGDAEEKVISIIPSTQIVSGQRAIGIAMDELGTIKLPPHLAVLEGARTTGILTMNVVVGLYDFFKGILTFNSDLSQVSGPVGIAKVVGEARSLGFVYLLTITALISINLAIINLLPFPALDGGRLLFVFIEAIIRRPIHPKFVRWTNTLGFAFLLILMVAVTVHDVVKLF